jgi:hypothetical protein
MQLRLLLAAIGLFGMLSFSQSTKAQSIAVGAPSLEDYLRRLQLTGKVDSASSFMIRPLIPTAAFGLAHGFDLDGGLVNLDSSSYHQRLGKRGKFLLLPALYKSQFTSNYPFATNDGAMIPNRGLQQVFSLGAFVEWWKFSLQVQPELVMAQNKEFIGFPIEQQSTILFYYEYLNRIDMPERFGDRAYQKLVPGQSSFRLNLDAISLGTTDGLKLAVNVGAILIVFTALMYVLNWVLGSLGYYTGINSLVANFSKGRYDALSFQMILGYLFSPIAWLIGVSERDMVSVGQLLGEKTIINEFQAYITFGKMKAENLITDPKSILITTYALCGFANIASIGIQIGGISQLAPGQRKNLTELGFKALIGGTIACLMCACIAGAIG